MYSTQKYYMTPFLYIAFYKKKFSSKIKVLENRRKKKQ